MQEDEGRKEDESRKEERNEDEGMDKNARKEGMDDRSKVVRMGAAAVC